MKNDFYTYAYLREDGSPYYIGKGRGRRAFNRNNRKGAPTPKDRNRILFLKKNLTEGEAFKHEIYMIAIYGRKNIGTGILYNFTDGGEGGSGRVDGEITKRKRSEANKGRKRKSWKLSEETKGEMRERMKGNIRGSGRRSEEFREKMSKAMGGNTNSLGRKISEETRNKISKSLKGRNLTEETKRRMGKLHEKSVEVFYPSGTVGVFPSMQQASFFLGIDSTTLYRWVKKKVVNAQGKYKGYSARYL